MFLRPCFCAHVFAPMFLRPCFCSHIFGYIFKNCSWDADRGKYHSTISPLVSSFFARIIFRSTFFTAELSQICGKHYPLSNEPNSSLSKLSLRCFPSTAKRCFNFFYSTCSIMWTIQKQSFFKLKTPMPGNVVARGCFTRKLAVRVDWVDCLETKWCIN